jgi:hypothetical protein
MPKEEMETTPSTKINPPKQPMDSTEPKSHMDPLTSFKMAIIRDAHQDNSLLKNNIKHVQVETLRKVDRWDPNR